jgi:rhodanese-related sulfurtransferase
MQKELLLINALGVEAFADCSIKGSVNVPLKDLVNYAKNLDKNTEIIVYCAHAHCSVSRQAWHTLHKLGFNNVKAYEGGMREWFKLGLPCVGLCKQDYLQQPLPKAESDGQVTTISVQELRNKIQ